MGCWRGHAGLSIQGSGYQHFAGEGLLRLELMFVIPPVPTPYTDNAACRRRMIVVFLQHGIHRTICVPLRCSVASLPRRLQAGGAGWCTPTSSTTTPPASPPSGTAGSTTSTTTTPRSTTSRSPSSRWVSVGPGRGGAALRLAVVEAMAVRESGHATAHRQRNASGNGKPVESAGVVVGEDDAQVPGFRMVAAAEWQFGCMRCKDAWHTTVPPGARPGKSPLKRCNCNNYDIASTVLPLRRLPLSRPRPAPCPATTPKAPGTPPTSATGRSTSRGPRPPPGREDAGGGGWWLWWRGTGRAWLGGSWAPPSTGA